MQESAAAAIDTRIVDWDVSIEVRDATHRLVTSTGGDVLQRYRFIYPGCAVTGMGVRVTAYPSSRRRWTWWRWRRSASRRSK